jgi:ATP-dependent DNA helicase RecQ
VIKRASNSSLSATVVATLELARQGNTPQQIANVRGLKRSTIYTHLANAIEGGRLQAGDVLTLPNAEIVAIQEAILALPEGEHLTLKPVFGQFAGKYDYGFLRCVWALMLANAVTPGANEATSSMT